MKFVVIISMIVLGPVFAKDKLETTVINSPVKETYLKVKLEGFESISEVNFKPKNGGIEIPGEVLKESNTFIGRLKVSNLKPGSYEYRIKVKVPSGKSANNEAASLDFITFVIDSSLEVSDPGEAGNKTLSGIDSDKDGVRDDVQRWINEEYPLSSVPSTNRALKQNAKILQIMIQNSNIRALAKQYQDKSLEAASCLWWIRGVRNQIYQNARARLFNTPERIQANLKVEEYSRGASRPTSLQNVDIDQQNQFCEFQAIKEQ